MGRGGNRDTQQLIEGCPFCAIVSGADSGAEVVCEGDGWVAFLPLEPATPGHTLIVPRDHVVALWATSSETARELVDAAIEVGHAIEHALDPDGLNLITSAGVAAEQTVEHLHLHIVPRWDGDGFGRIWPERASGSDADRRDVAARIRAACG